MLHARIAGLEQLIAKSSLATLSAQGNDSGTILQFDQSLQDVQGATQS